MQINFFEFKNTVLFILLNLKVIENTLPDKLGDPEVSKYNCNSSKGFQLMCP